MKGIPAQFKIGEKAMPKNKKTYLKSLKEPACSAIYIIVWNLSDISINAKVEIRCI